MRIPKLNKWDCVRVEWEDPHGLCGSWEKITKKDMAIEGCVTVGQVYRVHADRITIVCTWDTIEKNAHGGMTIPFSVISGLTVLARAEDFAQ